MAFDAGIDVEGVVSLEQGDQQMAEMTLEKLAEDNNGEANIVKIWTAGFAPMERRQIAYEKFLSDNPGIKEVTAFGAATNNTALDTQSLQYGPRGMSLRKVLSVPLNKQDVQTLKYTASI